MTRILPNIYSSEPGVGAVRHSPENGQWVVTFGNLRGSVLAWPWPGPDPGPVPNYHTNWTGDWDAAVTSRGHFLQVWRG